MRSSRQNLSLKILVFLLVFLSAVYISLISSQQWDGAASSDQDGQSTEVRQSDVTIGTTTPNWVEINAIKLPKSRVRTHIAGENRRKKKLFVIIVAGFRTGSTLLGEFFNKNDEIFYIFEPLHQVRKFHLSHQSITHVVTLGFNSLKLNKIHQNTPHI